MVWLLICSDPQENRWPKAQPRAKIPSKESSLVIIPERYLFIQDSPVRYHTLTAGPLRQWCFTYFFLSPLFFFLSFFLIVVRISGVSLVPFS